MCVCTYVGLVSLKAPLDCLDGWTLLACIHPDSHSDNTHPVFALVNSGSSKTIDISLVTTVLQGPHCPVSLVRGGVGAGRVL